VSEMRFLSLGARASGPRLDGNGEKHRNTQHTIGGRFQIRPSRSHSLGARASGPRADNDQVCCAYFILSPLQKLTTEYTEHAERLRFVNNFWPLGACKKNFTTLCSMKDKIIFSLCDLRGLCGEKITFLQ